MSSVTFSIIWSLISVVILLTALLSFYIYKILKNKKRKLKIEDISSNIKDSKLKKCDTVLSRIAKIAKSNKKFISLYERLSLIWDKMSDHMTILNKHVSILLLEYKSLSNKKFKNKINELKEEIDILKDFEIAFNNGALKLTRQDEFTRSEKSFYDKNLRIAIDVYKDKRILLDRISKEIDSLINEISEIDKKFDNALGSANTIEINQILINYSKKVISFCEIINKGPSLQNYIYNTVPKITQDLYELYNSMKKELKTSLHHINFVKSIENIANIHQAAKEHFKILKLSKAEQETREIIKSIKIIEKMINSEFVSRNIFVKNFEIIISEITKSLTEFVRIKMNIKEIKKKQINITETIKDSFEELSSTAKIIDAEGIEFKGILQNMDIPYSSKMTRMKLISQKLEDFINKINDINQKIFELDVNRQILKNKFTRAKYAFDSLAANIKQKNIRISLEEKKSIDEINQKISKANEKIASELISDLDVEYIEDVVEKIISTYRLLAGTVEISDIIKNLIKKLSINRAINDDLNYQLGIAEREYLEGKYASSLNAIIQYLEGE